MSASARLGRTQILVLRLLASHERAAPVRTLACAWPGLTESSVHSALERLGMRGLVDAAGFDGRARTYCLTAKGAEVEAALNEDDDS